MSRKEIISVLCLLLQILSTKMSSCFCSLCSDALMKHDSFSLLKDGLLFLFRSLAHLKYNSQSGCPLCMIVWKRFLECRAGKLDPTLDLPFHPYPDLILLLDGRVADPFKLDSLDLIMIVVGYYDNARSMFLSPEAVSAHVSSSGDDLPSFLRTLLWLPSPICQNWPFTSS